MKGNFPHKEFLELKDKWCAGAGDFYKYFERYKWCLDICETRMGDLGMVKDGPPLRVLDISTGFGFFPWLCRQYGHEVVITDSWKDNEFMFFNEVHGLLRLPYREYFAYHENQFQKLPDDIGTFDMITAFHVAPHGLWLMDDWLMYVADCRRHLVEGGRIVICPNNSRGRGNLMEVVDSFSILDVEMKGDCIVIYNSKKENDNG